MNKEEFKAKFLEQFNNPNSPSRALLYEFCRPWSKDNGIYRDSYQIHANEFGLVIDIQKQRVSDDEQYFNVQILNSNQIGVDVLNSINDLHDLTFFQGFYKENIRCEKHHLIFEIDCFSLVLKDYIYSLDNLFHLDVKYDCIRNEFESDEVLEGLLYYIDGIRPKPADAGNRYVEVSTLTPDIEKILNQMKVNLIADETIAHVKKAYESLSLGYEKSVMTEIMEYLLKNKMYVYPF